MLQSFRPSLQAVRTPQPAQAGFALDSRGLQPDGTRCIADLMLNLHQPDGTQARRPRTQDARASPQAGGDARVAAVVVGAPPVTGAALPPAHAGKQGSRAIDPQPPSCYTHRQQMRHRSHRQARR